MSEQRLQNLETVVRALREEVRQLADEVARLRTNGAAAPNIHGAKAAAPDRAALDRGDSGAAAKAVAAPVRGGPPVGKDEAEPTFRRHQNRARPTGSFPIRQKGSDVSLEDLVGRYGTLAIAAVLVVMGVGAFVTWAATRFVIGPGARVVLGALAALALALVGRRLAARGSRAFGSTLLALALAVAHVDAWAAGPVLHVVPNMVALGAAALASFALAVLAIRERSESLFAVGLGGALIAPFVTGDSSSPLILLLSYGWVVIATALAASRPREWTTAPVMVTIGGIAYAASAVDSTGRSVPDLLATGLFPLACAWAAFSWSTDRSRMALSLGFSALGALVAFALAIEFHEPVLVAAAVLGTATVYFHVETRETSTAEATVGVLLVPLVLLLAAFTATDFAEGRGVAIALGWMLAALILTRFSRAWRDLHLVTASIALVAALLFALNDAPVACIMVLAATSASVAFLARRENAPSIMVASWIPLGIAAVWSHYLLFDRPAFAYTPLLTQESLAAASVVAAGFACWRFGSARDRQFESVWMLLFAVPLFFWIRAELERAIRPEVATFLLILFYAVAGVAVIAAGRRWQSSQLRIAGLVLAIYAAAKAVVQASGLTMIGLRVGSYLLVGGFLLAVAYWYRAAASRDESADASQQPSPTAVGM